jgi:hypothetical protein
MDQTKLDSLTKAMDTAIRVLRDSAADLCADAHIYDVYQLMKESFALDAKLRQIQRRYGK